MLSRTALVSLLTMLVILLSGVDASASDGGGSTAVVDPDAYVCPERGFIDFESFADATDLSAQTFDSVAFTTTDGYTWQVGDFAGGDYNGKHPDGAYTRLGLARTGPRRRPHRLHAWSGELHQRSHIVEHDRVIGRLQRR
jgi:hypothetical protein